MTLEMAGKPLAGPSKEQVAKMKGRSETLEIALLIGL